MLVSLYKVILPVTDVDQAENFYSRLLGVPGRRVSADRHDFDCGGMTLSCLASTGGAAGSPPPGQRVWFAVDELDAAFQQATNAGCEIVDSQIVTHPWGDRLFLGTDPFKNSVGFVDRTTMERQKGETQVGGPDDRLHLGLVLAVQLAQGRGENRLAASICRIFKDEIWLQFANDPGEVFKEKNSVQIQYYEEHGAVVSYTDVVRVSSSDEKFLAISMPETLELLQRRAAPRVATAVPVRFTVTASEQDEARVSGQEVQSRTRDISTGGMRFETESPLGKGDSLDIKLVLSADEEVFVNAKVTDTRPVERGDKTCHSVGTQFVEMHLDDQIKLLQYLIEHEERGPLESGAGPDADGTAGAEPANAPLASASPAGAKDEPSPPMKFAPEVAVPVGSDASDSSLPSVGGAPPGGALPVVEGVLEGSSSADQEPSPSPLPPVVQALPLLESGQIYLELANGFRDRVKVNSVSVAKGAGSRVELLEQPAELAPGQRQRVDVTTGLLRLFDPDSSESQERKIQVVLALNPEPPTQPGPSLYHVKFSQQTFTHFSGGV